MQFEKFVAKAYFLPQDVRMYVLKMSCFEIIEFNIVNILEKSLICNSPHPAAAKKTFPSRGRVRLLIGFFKGNIIHLTYGPEGNS